MPEDGEEKAPKPKVGTKIETFSIRENDKPGRPVPPPDDPPSEKKSDE